jgi:hypothetical protein
MLVILTGSGVRMGPGQQVARRTWLHVALLQVIPPPSSTSGPAGAGGTHAGRSCWLVILMALRIASQRCGVFTASVRLRFWLAGIVRYLLAALMRGPAEASS